METCSRWRSISSVFAVVTIVHLIACSHGAYPGKRSRPAGLWQDRHYAERCNPSGSTATLDTFGAVLGGTLLFVGVGAIASGEGGTVESEGIALGAGLLFGVPGALLLASYASSARWGHRRARECRAERAKPSPDRRAVDLSESARTLAARGDCAGARKLALRVPEFDGRYFELETARDPEIRRCLDEQARDQSITGPGQP